MDDLQRKLAEMNPGQLMKVMNPPDLSEINHWMNFRCRKVATGKWVVLTEDHRGVLPVIALALKKGVFSSAPTLLRLDRHADYEEDAQQCLFHGEQCVDYLRHISDTQVQSDDSTWLRVAHHAGFFANAGTWYVDDRENKPFGLELDKVWADADYNGQSHSLWFTSTMSEWVARLQGGDAGTIEMATGCKLELEAGSLKPAEGAEFWLDIDLDFAATSIDFSTRGPDSKPWDEAEFNAEFGGTQACAAMESLIKAAKLITIATEPVFCGGYLAAAETLERLHTLFPNDGVFQW